VAAENARTLPPARAIALNDRREVDLVDDRNRKLAFMTDVRN